MSDTPPSAPTAHRPPSDCADSGPYSPLKDPTVLLMGLIVVGALGLWITGMGTPLTGGDGGGGPLFPFRDYDNDTTPVPTETPAPRVAVSANRTKPRAGSDVLIRVRSPDGSPVNATVELDGRTYTTGSDGNVVVTAASVGNRTVVATPKGSEFREATLDLRVRRRLVRLRVRVAPGKVRVDEQVTVQVVRRDTRGPVNATVVANGTRRRTGDDGRLRLSFGRAGTVEVEARLEGNRSVTFANASTTVRVRRIRTSLELTVVGDEFLVGERPVVGVQRTDTGEFVQATIVVDGTEYETGAGGVLRLPALEAGTYTIRAKADPTPRVRFTPDSERITVRRKRVGLTVSVDSNTVRSGDAVVVTVRRADTGAPVNATVRVAGRTTRTGPDGRVSVPTNGYGKRRVVATKGNTTAETFEQDATTVTVLGADLAIESSDIPERVASGDPVTAVVTLINRGNAAGETSVVYRVGGRTIASRTVSVPAGESRTVRLSGWLPFGTGTTAVQTVTAAGETVSGTLVVETGNESDGNETDGNATAVDSAWQASDAGDSTVRWSPTARTPPTVGEMGRREQYRSRAIDKTSKRLLATR